MRGILSLTPVLLASVDVHAEQNEATQVQQVVSMLEDVKANGERAKLVEQKVFGDYSKWVDDVKPRLRQEITTEKSTITNDKKKKGKHTFFTKAEKNNIQRRLTNGNGKLDGERNSATGQRHTEHVKVGAVVEAQRNMIPDARRLEEWLLAVVLRQDTNKPRGMDLFSLKTPGLTAAEAISGDTNFGIGMDVTLTFTKATTFRLECTSSDGSGEHVVYLRGIDPSDVHNAFRATGTIKDTSSLECNPQEDFLGAGATGATCLSLDSETHAEDGYSSAAYLASGYSHTYWKMFPSGSWALYDKPSSTSGSFSSVRHCAGSNELQFDKAQIWVKKHGLKTTTTTTSSTGTTTTNTSIGTSTTQTATSHVVSGSGNASGVNSTNDGKRDGDKQDSALIGAVAGSNAGLPFIAAALHAGWCVV